jgi:hypothetical protein
VERARTRLVESLTGSYFNSQFKLQAFSLMTNYLALLIADFCNSVIMSLSQLSDLFSVLMQSCRLFFSLPQPHTCCDTVHLIGISTYVLLLVED